MKTFERILLKLVFTHLVLLTVVQLVLHQFEIMEYANKLIHYEGVSGLEDQHRHDVFKVEQ